MTLLNRTGKFRLTAAMALAICCLGLAACAGPNGERPKLDNAVVRPNSTEYSFTGGYAGAVAGTGPGQR